MSEQQLLLPASNFDARRPTLMAWRAKTSHFLDSRALHKTVISLIAIDAGCVLTDLIYTTLSPGCIPPGPEAPAWLEVLAHISLAITTFFLAEVPLTLWAFGLQHYNPFGPITHASLHLFDALIIVTTFVLEVVLKGRERELASLLVVLRLWRIIKLVGGVAVGVGEIGEEDSEELAETRKEVEKVRADLATAREENEHLRRRLAMLEGSI